MNIFKVLASGRKSFSEESASVFLAWLLHPNMEHGLGPRLLQKFIEGVKSQCTDETLKGQLKELTASTEPSLRVYDDRPEFGFELHLEMNVAGNFTDIVIRINDWWFSIENKIRGAAINREKEQIRVQYEGLRNHLDSEQVPGDDHRIVVVYLLPIEASASLADGLRTIEPKGRDFAVGALWQSMEDSKGTTDYFSVHDMIAAILSEEASGKTDPLPEHLRHTLKAFLSFITSGFHGYRYERSASTGGMNPDTTDLFTLDRIASESIGFVGIQGGVAGLLQSDADSLKMRKFQFSNKDMAAERNWMSVEEFNEIAKWLTCGEKPDRKWEGVFSAKALYRIARAYGDSVFIGISGGEEALRHLATPEAVAAKRWAISNEKKTKQWVSGSTFAGILTELGFDEK